MAAKTYHVKGGMLQLSAAEKARTRRLIVKYAKVGKAHASAIHYTQGTRRWDYIELHKRGYRGQYPNYGDCSGYASGLLWDALLGFKPVDVVNGENWHGGYTGTMGDHGAVVHHGRKIGDLLLYGPGTHEHVTVYIGQGQVFSHGSEAGPYILPWNYRGDLSETRRYFD